MFEGIHGSHPVRSSLRAGAIAPAPTVRPVSMAFQYHLFLTTILYALAPEMGDQFTTKCKHFCKKIMSNLCLCSFQCADFFNQFLTDFKHRFPVGFDGDVGRGLVVGAALGLQIGDVGDVHIPV